MVRSAIATQIAICTRPTAPTPRILPSMRAWGLAAATMISTMRLVFSWTTERSTLTA
jgi:hypothetical protein